MGSEDIIPITVRYLFDLLRAVSPSTLLRTLRFSKGKVEPPTATGIAVRPEVSKDEQGERDFFEEHQGAFLRFRPFIPSMPFGIHRCISGLLWI